VYFGFAIETVECSGKLPKTVIRIATQTFKNHKIGSQVVCEKPPLSKEVCENSGECTGMDCSVKNMGHFTGLKQPNNSGSAAHS
jgi:hypothetical protein